MADIDHTPYGFALYRLTGLRASELRQLLEQVVPVYVPHLRTAKQRPNQIRRSGAGPHFKYPPHAHVLLAVIRLHAGLTYKELSPYLQIDAGTLQRTCKRIEPILMPKLRELGLMSIRRSKQRHKDDIARYRRGDVSFVFPREKDYYDVLAKFTEYFPADTTVRSLTRPDAIDFVFSKRYIDTHRDSDKGKQK